MQLRPVPVLSPRPQESSVAFPPKNLKRSDCNRVLACIAGARLWKSPAWFKGDILVRLTLHLVFFLGELSQFLWALLVEATSGGAVVKNPPANARDGSLMPGSGRSSREGNDYPLQYSCLGNPTDRGAWQATVHRVTGCWTRLSGWACIEANRRTEFWSQIYHFRASHLSSPRLRFLICKMKKTTIS